MWRQNRFLAVISSLQNHAQKEKKKRIDCVLSIRMCTDKCIHCIVASSCGNVGNSTVAKKQTGSMRQKQTRSRSVFRIDVK